jgi:rhodanese-related sulfurtransferase
MQAVGILEGLGYRNLVNVQDGILGWIAADAPVVGGDSAITGAKLIDVYNRAAFDVMIVDVREKDEFAAGHIPSAINVPLSTLTPAVAHEILPTAGRVLYIHCQGGYRSAKFIAQLKDFGYSNFINISDGIQGWIDAGGAIVTESARKQPRTELDMALAAMGLAALPTIRHPLFL